MAWVQNDLTGYINTDNIVRITDVLEIKTYLNTQETPKYYFKLLLASGSINSAKYDTSGDATTARTALISALGI